jgi:hypothetical protein
MIFDEDQSGKCEVEEYLVALINVLAPLGYILNGKLDCINTDYIDLYGIFVKNNKVTVKTASKITYASRPLSKWNNVAKTYDLIPFHMPKKLLDKVGQYEPK